MKDAEYMTFAKEIIACFINRFTPLFSKKGCILMYHSIGTNDKYSTVTPETFEKQLQFLHKNKYTVLPLSEFITRVYQKEDLTGCVTLTFDDGYSDFYTTAYPLLKKYNMASTVFVITGYIGQPYKNRQGQVFDILSHDQITELVASGIVEVMPHSETHPKLSHIPFESAIDEIEKSRTAIEKITGKHANFFAYPSGRYSDQIVDYLSNNPSWRAAVTVRPGLVDHQTPPMLLNRNMIDSTVDMQRFRMYLSDGVLWVNKMKR